MKDFLRKLGWKGWIIVWVVLAALGVTLGPYAYFNFIAEEAPAPLTAASAQSTSVSTTETSEDSSGEAVPVEGKWVIAKGSIVGYRVEEILFGQRNTAAGRTEDVTGEMEISERTVTKASFEVDMTTVKSDQERRDRQFNGRIMDTASFPTSTFVLTEPIALDVIPQPGVEGTTKATGTLTLKGTAKTVTFDIKGKRVGSTIQVSGQIPIVFEVWGIDNPSGGPAETEDNGILEFALKFERS